MGGGSVGNEPREPSLSEARGKASTKVHFFHSSVCYSGLDGDYLVRDQGLEFAATSDASQYAWRSSGSKGKGHTYGQPPAREVLVQRRAGQHLTTTAKPGLTLGFVNSATSAAKMNLPRLQVISNFMCVSKVQGIQISNGMSDCQYLCCSTCGTRILGKFVHIFGGRPVKTMCRTAIPAALFFSATAPAFVTAVLQLSD